jgi:hypothetical protein
VELCIVYCGTIVFVSSTAVETLGMEGMRSNGRRTKQFLRSQGSAAQNIHDWRMCDEAGGCSTVPLSIGVEAQIGELWWLP